MATKKPRLTVSLEQSQFDVISEISRLRCVPKSAIITDVVDASMPVFERLLVVLRALHSASSPGVASEIASNLEAAERVLAPLLASATRQIEDELDRLPPSNTGVTSPPPSPVCDTKKDSKPLSGAASSSGDGYDV